MNIKIVQARVGKAAIAATFSLALIAGVGTTAIAAPAVDATPSAVTISKLAVQPQTQFVTAEGGVPSRVSVWASCGGGRCTVYLSRTETAALARGAVPAPPAFLPLPLKVAYYGAAYAHRWFAGQYASRGWCSGFRLSIYPWESQGYFGYAC